MARRTATRALQAPVGPQNFTLPYLWSQRSYQNPLCCAMPFNPGTKELHRKRLMLCWHRRAGKDLTALALTVCQMLSNPPGLYWHILPTFRQAKTALWDGIDDGGIPFMDRIPQGLIAQKNETELQVVLKPVGNYRTGAVWQLRGADDINSLRGANPIGVVLSEYSEMKEAVWTEVIQPILEQNGGWAMFIFTPKGRNHSFKLFTMAQSDPLWFAQRLTIDQTKRDAVGENGEPCVTPQQIEQMRKEGVPEWSIQQEYYCSFEGFLRGTIFGDLVDMARKEGRIGNFPHVSNLPVGVLMDIGRTDATALWFYQRVGQQIVFIDYFEDTLQGADYYARKMREKPYLISKVILPHDARVKGFTATESPEQFFRRMFRGVTVAPKLALQTGIDMTRRIFSKCYFDQTKCATGIDHLENYRRKYNEDLHDYSGEPIHDEHSHGADAFRMGAQGGMEYPLEFDEERSKRNPHMAETDFSIFSETVQ